MSDYMSVLTPHPGNLIAGLAATGVAHLSFGIVLHSIGKVVGIPLMALADLSFVQSHGISITGVLTFGGIRGIGFCFAAEDALGNVFGGSRLQIDRTFKSGEPIRSPDMVRP